MKSRFVLYRLCGGVCLHLRVMEYLCQMEKKTKQANDPSLFAAKQIIAFQTDDKMCEAIMAFMVIIYFSRDSTLSSSHIGELCELSPSCLKVLLLVYFWVSLYS